jgi:hypothetical protein
MVCLTTDPKAIRPRYHGTKTTEIMSQNKSFFLIADFLRNFVMMEN